MNYDLKIAYILNNIRINDANGLEQNFLHLLTTILNKVMYTIDYNLKYRVVWIGNLDIKKIQERCIKSFEMWT